MKKAQPDQSMQMPVNSSVNQELTHQHQIKLPASRTWESDRPYLKKIIQHLEQIQNRYSQINN